MTEKQLSYEVRYIGNDDIEEKFREECKDKVLVGPKQWCVPRAYDKIKENLFNLEVRPDDVWITGYPRSGTTMTQELIWLIGNDLDFKTALKVPNYDRVLLLEAHIFNYDKWINNNTLSETNNENKKLNKLINMEDRRFLKTHFSFSLLPQSLLKVGAKVVYVARNPKDVITSLYNFTDLIKQDGYKLNFKEHCELFMKGLHLFCPYLDHVKEAWDLRHEKNILFMFYEDIVKDKQAAIKKIATFLGKTLSETDIQALTAHLDINNFRKHKSLSDIELKDVGRTNKNREYDFIRKGVIGDWKNFADPELDKMVTRWIEDGLRGSEITFKYD